MTRFCFCLVLGVMLLSTGTASGQRSLYAPEVGNAAVSQRSLDVRTPAVVAAFWLEPGYEDYSTLAYLRLGLGARVISIYATNGSETPSDLDNAPPFAVGALRREEAYRAMSRIDVETYFLCLPNITVATGEEEVLSLWNADTVAAKLMDVGRRFRPDLLLIGRDLRPDSGVSARVNALIRGIEHTVGFRGKPVDPDTRRRPWTAMRTLLDRGISSQPFTTPGKLVHPVWKKTYDEIGHECAGVYRSLWGQMAWMQRNGERSYSVRDEGGKKAPKGYFDGLRLFTPRIQRVQRIVDLAARGAPALPWQQAADRVTAAIDSVSRQLMTIDFERTPREGRILTTWKTNLEALRCAVLGVRVTAVMSESLLTSRQVVFFTIDSVQARSRFDSLEILFPSGANQEWIINEAGQWRFPLHTPEEFRVLSPETMEISYPASAEAIQRAGVRTGFPFLIFHVDRIRSRSFAYRGVYDFRIGPLHSCEVMTPIVRAAPGARVAYSAMSFSRDPSRNAVTLVDSLVSAGPRVLYFKGKDAVVNDTLTLTFSENLPPGDRRVDIKIGKKLAANFIVRPFPALADTAAPVGVVTGLRTSAVSDALERLHIPVRFVGPGQLRPEALREYRVVVIDRDALVLRPDMPQAHDALLEWVRAGGQLVVLPQFSATAVPAAQTFEFTFRSRAGIPPSARLTLDSASALLRTPNRIQEEDWSGWVGARALGMVEAGKEYESPARDAATGEALIASGRLGNGRITLVALDLISQLVNVHPGAHRLLANLVWPR
jgi:hypothetical protein